jgi:hypothetical protein
MPIVSKKQQGFMFAEHPKIAHKMAERMKKKSGKKHPLKGLPTRSKDCDESDGWGSEECGWDLCVEHMESIR